MAYQSTYYMFKSLTDKEEKEFREYAQKNDPQNLANWNIYHPVCREEWEKRGITPLDTKEE